MRRTFDDELRQACLYSRSVSTANARKKPVAVRAQVTTEAPSKVAKVSKKSDEGVVTNKYKPKEPYVGTCLLNTKITGDDAPGETWHMVFSTEGKVALRNKKLSSVLPSVGLRNQVEFDRVHVRRRGSLQRGAIDRCDRRRRDLKPGAEVKITGPVGKEMLMPKDPNATVIMLGTGTGIAPFRSFLWKMFFEKYDDYKFNGLAWLFLGVPTSSSLLYKEVSFLATHSISLRFHVSPTHCLTRLCVGVQEFEKMKERAPDNFRVDYAVSREQTNEKGEKMYIQTRMAEYAGELWELLKKDNTFVYMCGLKGMEKGIDDIMVSLAANDGKAQGISSNVRLKSDKHS
ncbi:hypothetical protein BHM03_00011819 [Ensete ventricosum]|uniref:Oxidoreductase FAD/NAD(P)-binding domain-containing protein n=1 Tax=Ensete ventricosum TaxID=4639 RepID=A0A445MDG6_ENSVE|nr:hypothetical protein BHM03_00011819 [Ensete ventricosum]